MSDPTNPARLGIFGGTFDPPHTGHLLAATDAFETLQLDKLWLVPNSIQPLKGAGQGAAADRLQMVRLLAGEDPRFGVESLEIERRGPSYTVETLSAFAARFPDSRRFLLIGADVTATFDRWREPQRITELAEVVVLRRARDEGKDLADTQGTGSRWLAGAKWLETRRLDISSTEIRERVRMGKPIRGFVPDAVAEYIAAAGLYR